MALLEARTYSERLGHITGAQLQEAADSFDLGTITAATSPPAGQWGQNILLSTTQGAFVLRGNPQPPEQLLKERAVASVITERSSIAAPWPYRVSENANLFGWTFAIMPMLAGTLGSILWDEADDAGRLDLAHAHGEALARLHQATFAAPGPYSAETDGFAAVDDYAAWTLRRVESLSQRCRAIGALSPDDDQYIEAIIDSCSPALREPFVPVLVHHDFSLANTTYEVEGGKHRAVGVIDLGETHIGDGEEDLVRFLFRRRRAQRHAFIATYVEAHPLRPGAADRLQLYALADFLFMWEVSWRGSRWFGDSSFVDAAHLILENAREVVT